MFYYLFDFLNKKLDVTGAGVFQYITFRSTMAILLSLVIALVFGKKMIQYLQKKQIGETVRDLGLDGQIAKKGTPTMGGIIIILAIIIPTLLFAKLSNVYIILMLVSTIWLGAVGFIDDYIKVFKKNKEGLAGRFKVLGQVGLGLIIGCTLYFNKNVVVQREAHMGQVVVMRYEKVVKDSIMRIDELGVVHEFANVKSPITTIPFFKSHEFN
jgi:phospho-N-acetylmuramoyl-pentapeptide-transferase